jgi:hypothetical protein
MLSHHHRTIFVHVPKCAGQSVESAFLADVGLTWETRAPLLLRANEHPALGPPRLAHLLARDYVQLRYVPEEMFAAYYRFGLVRNPWSRAVSLYRHLEPDMSFVDFVGRWLPDEFDRRDWQGSWWFVRPQADYLFDADELLVRDVVRFETLADEFPRIAAASSLVSPLPHINRSGSGEGAARSRHRRLRWRLRRSRFEMRPAWRDYYTAETVSGIARLYAEDVERFGYVF